MTKSFCWSRLDILYDHVFQKELPIDKYSFNALKSTEFLWLITEQIFKCDDIQQCEDFKLFFYPSKVLLKSNEPIPILIGKMAETPRISSPLSSAMGSGFAVVSYQSCNFKKMF